MIKSSKRVICCLLSLILCFSFVVGSASETEAVTDNTSAEMVTISSEIQEMMNVLRLFEIIPDYYDYNVPIASEVTRADFVSAVAKLIGKNGYSGTNVYFYDVPKTHWAYNEISSLAEMGIISGSGNKMFNPDVVIAKSEAYKILLKIMGYDLYAEHNGGYPIGYITTAVKIKLARGVDNGANLTMSDMFYLLYNAMRIDIMKPVLFSDAYMEYDVEEGVSILSLYRDVYYKKGVVKGANTITVDNSHLDKDCTLIDDVIYNNGNTETFDFIGQNVEFFYHQQKNDDDKTLLWACALNTNEILSITVDNSASFDEKTFVLTYYDENDKKCTVKLSRGITLIYNGGIIESEYDKIFNKKRYFLNLIANKGDYAIALVKEYETYVAGSINTLDYKIYDKKNPTTAVDLDKNSYDTFSIKMPGLTDFGFEDIKPGYVLSVFKSADEKHMEVIVSNSNVTGTIRTIETDIDYNNIFINDSKYRIAKNIYEEIFTPGVDVTAYLDTYGDIAYMEIKSSVFQGAFLIDLTVMEGLSNVLSIKHLAEDGNVTVSKCAKKVIIDGKSFKDGKEIEKELLGEGKEFASQFALIKKNADKEITEIDTVENPHSESSSSLHIDVPFKEESEQTITAKMIRTSAAATKIGEKIIFDADTKIFSIPTIETCKEADDVAFTVLAATGLVNDTTVKVQSYKTTEDGGISKYLLVQDYAPDTAFAYPVIVDNIGSGISETGDNVEILNGYQGNVPVSLVAASETPDVFSKSNAEPGALVKIKKNKRGEINKCELLYDGDGNETTDTTVKGLYMKKLTSGFSLYGGYVNNIIDDVLKIGYDSGASFDFATRVGSAIVLVYDKNSPNVPVYSANIGDAITYKNNTANCSKVVIVTSKMQAQMVLIYK